MSTSLITPQLESAAREIYTSHTRRTHCPTPWHDLTSTAQNECRTVAILIESFVAQYPDDTATAVWRIAHELWDDAVTESDLVCIGTLVDDYLRGIHGYHTTRGL